MKGILGLVLLLGGLVAGCGDPPGPVSPPTTDEAPQTERFVDRALAAAVGEAASRQGEDSLRSLVARERGIRSLAGIEGLHRLQVLDLAGNEVADAGPLAGLTGLRFLDLAGNRLTDLSPLQGLVRLEVLSLEHNLVPSARPLIPLRALQYLDLTGNPLDSGSVDLLAELELRGVRVVFEEDGSGTGAALPLVLDFGVVFAARSTNDWYDLFLQWPDGEDAHNITNAAREYEELALSADGRRVAFVSNRSNREEFPAFWHLWTMAVDGGDLLKVTAEPAGAGRLRELTWSPDGRRIALSRRFSFPSESRYYAGIYLVDLEDGRLTPLTNREGANGVTDVEPAWSPDGDRIAFRRHDPSMAGHHILVADLEGRLTDLTPEAQDASAPRWDPRGTDILYAGDPGYDIHRAAIDGGPVARLTQQPANYDPVWSPDGSRIAFVSTRAGGGRHEILVMDRDGGDLRVLTSDLLVATSPRWSPDGREIAFLRGHPSDEGSAIWAMDATDGSSKVNLTNLVPGFTGEFLVVPRP